MAYCQELRPGLAHPGTIFAEKTREDFEVPEGYTGRVSSVRPVYLEERDDRGFPRIIPVEELGSGRYRLEGNLIRQTSLL